MPTPTELLKKKINLREAALRAREAETAAREAELQELKEELQKLQSTRSGIRAAIEDALSDSPTTDIEPTDLLEMAVEGEGNADDDEPFANGNLTAEEALRLALASIKKELGSKRLVKFIIQAAVDSSRLDAEGVIKAALETVRGSELRVQDVVLASLQAARNTRNISASEIMRPAVGVSMELGAEIPVIIKEVFVAMGREPSMLRSSLLSILGCAVGMGMTYRDIKEIMKAFSKEIKHGTLGQRAADDPPKKVRFSIPPEQQDPNTSSPTEPQDPPARDDAPGHSHSLDLLVVIGFINSGLKSLHYSVPGLSAAEDPAVLLDRWPAEYATAQDFLQQITREHPRAVAPSESAKRSADDDGEEDAGTTRPSKKAKTRRQDYPDEDD